jgi:hypothetical protein
MGTIGADTYVDSVYRMGDDYLNLSQGPLLQQPAFPSSEPVTVRGLPGQLLEMGGIRLVQWNEGGSRVTATSDTPREDLLLLVEALTPV